MCNVVKRLYAIVWGGVSPYCQPAWAGAISVFFAAHVYS